MASFAHRLTYQSRQYGDYGPSPLPRGTCRVQYDGRVHCYRIKKGERRAFTRWYAEASQAGLTGYRVTGAWPEYSLERID